MRNTYNDTPIDRDPIYGNLATIARALGRAGLDMVLAVPYGMARAVSSRLSDEPGNVAGVQPSLQLPPQLQGGDTFVDITPRKEPLVGQLGGELRR